MSDQKITYSNPVELRYDSPGKELRTDVIYMPNNPSLLAGKDLRWGIYSSSGNLPGVIRIIDAAAYRRERKGILIGQSSEQHLAGQVDLAPEGDYIYGGHINPHFGHFIINTLSRYWSVLQGDFAGKKVICHGQPGHIERWFSQPHIKEMFEAIDLHRNDFITFSRPTKIPRIEIPLPSLIENYCVHRVYGTLCHWIGDEILADFPLNSASSRPIYLSKLKLKRTYHSAINEDEICDVLVNEGVEIIYPETLSVAEQIALWRSRTFIMGIVGSALHTSCFSPAGPKIVGLNLRKGINSNCGLIDIVNKNNVTYVSPECEALAQWSGQSQTIANAFRIKNPKAAAYSLLRAIEA